MVKLSLEKMAVDICWTKHLSNLIRKNIWVSSSLSWFHGSWQDISCPCWHHITGTFRRKSVSSMKFSSIVERKLDVISCMQEYPLNMELSHVRMRYVSYVASFPLGRYSSVEDPNAQLFSPSIISLYMYGWTRASGPRLFLQMSDILHSIDDLYYGESRSLHRSINQKAEKHADRVEFCTFSARGSIQIQNSRDLGPFHSLPLTGKYLIKISGKDTCVENEILI